MKILFLMDSPEYLRFFDSAIEELAARGHHVSLAVGWSREKKPVGLEGLRGHVANVEAIGVVPHAQGLWADISHWLRGTMDFVRYLHPRFASAPALRDRMKRKVLPSAYNWLDSIPRLSAPAVRRIERMLMAGERAIPLSRPIVDFLREQAPDVLLVSPLVAAASPQVDWIKAARALGIRTGACIASWDNLTNKGLLRVEPDRVIVWNEAQKQEAQEYHYIPADKVVVTGAQLFDRWFTRRPTRDRAAFCARVGLPDDRPFLLFTGSSVFISRSNIEVPFVRRWIETVRTSGDATLREMNILVRPHPYNYHAWVEDPLSDLSRVTVFPRQAYNPIDEANRADFFDSLYHCSAVIGVNTSAMIEAAILGKPVFSMLSEEFSGTQEGTVHFHYLLPENGGFLRIASGLPEHVRQLSERMADVEGARAETARFVSSFLRPGGLDRPATPLFVNAIEQLGAAPAPKPAPAPAWSAALRPLLLAAASVQIAARAAPKKHRIPGRRALKTFRGRSAKTAHRAWKEFNKLLRVSAERIRRRARLTGKQWQKTVVKPLRTRR